MNTHQSRHQFVNMTLRIMLLLVILALALAGCSGQATPAPVDDSQTAELDFSPVVSATGIVVPDRWSTLSLTTGGVVEQLLVEAGDTVEAGQVLLRLKGGNPEDPPEDVQARLLAAKLEVQSAEKTLKDLTKNADLSRDEALRQISLASKQFRDAQYNLDNISVPAKQKNLDPFEAYDQLLAELDAARLAYEPYKYYPEEDETRKERKEDLDTAQSDFNAAVRRLQANVDLQLAQVNLDNARQDYAKYLAGPDPDEVALAQLRLENARAAEKAAEAVFDDLELVAPFAGTVTEVFTRPGEWVAPGAPVVQIADLSKLRVETTDLNEIDMAQIEPGDPVVVSFDALPEVVVPGTVSFIAPKVSTGSGVNYKVVIALDELPARLRWGMSSFVDITIDEEP